MKETRMNETIMTTSGNYTTIRCEELARLKAIEKAAETTFKALNWTLSALLMWEESAPTAWDDTDIAAVDLANKALAEYEKAVGK